MINKSIPKETQRLSTDNPNQIQNLKPILLLKPKFESDHSVISAFNKRKTIREISDKKLSLQTLSDLLWAHAV